MVLGATLYKGYGYLKDLKPTSFDGNKTTSSTEDGDNLIVKVLSSDGTTVLARGRIVSDLKEGVYLYTAEVVEGTSSQTMVGVAAGNHAVDVSMNLNVELSVEDEIVVPEHVWRRRIELDK